LGENRNGSYIDKNTAIQMANSLPTCPIVGCFREEAEDFGDHGHVIKIEDGEVKFSVKTRPYGFVAPDAKVWFQKFIDTDEFGNEVEREYMMTTGYLWTGQYEEAMSVVESGKGQSMELDEETLDGHWATNNKNGLEFFIINDAVFSKLCILGDDVEPCFEGASISALTEEFSADADFAHSLYSMMKELKDILADEGGLKMPQDQKDFSKKEAETVEVESVVPEPVPEPEPAPEPPAVEETPSSGPVVMSTLAGEQEYVDKKDEQDKEDEEAPEEEDESETPAADDEDEDKKKPSTESALDIDAITKELEELRAFKLSIENERKDAVINKYHMLSDEDKADVVAHKAEYTIEQIDEKLALVYVRKNVDFSTIDGKPEEESRVDIAPALAFSLDDEFTNDGEAVDSIQEALREQREGL